MKIQILGSGCANCRNLEKNAREAVGNLGLEATIEKVTDPDQIMEMGVLRTPGLVVNGTVVRSGTVASPEQIMEDLRNASAP